MDFWDDWFDVIGDLFGWINLRAWLTIAGLSLAAFCCWFYLIK
jgi:hypothetical protein